MSKIPSLGATKENIGTQSVQELFFCDSSNDLDLVAINSKKETGNL